MKPARDEYDDLTCAVQRYESAEESTQSARALAEKSRDYYDGNQWTSAEVASLNRRNQAAIVINRIRPKIDFLQGVERKTRMDPKALPRTPNHDEEADTATQALRYVVDNVVWPQIASAAWENLLIEGTCGVDVSVDLKQSQDKPPEIEITAQRFHWDRIYYDPYARDKTFEDAQYLGAVIWMDQADAMAQWPERSDAIEASYPDMSQSDTYEDVPRWRQWADGKRNRVKICQEYFRKNGVWMVSTFCRGGFLEDPVESPFTGEDGVPECGFVFQSAYIDRDGNRYGWVRDMLDLQDEINHRRSKGLHWLSQRQTFGNRVAVADTRQTKIELAKPDGHVTLEGDAQLGRDFGVLPSNEFAAAQFQLLQESKAEIDGRGPSNAMLTQAQTGASGRALLVNEQHSNLEIEPLLDAYRAWQIRCYRAMWSRIRQFWRQEKWLRITDDPESIRWVGLNQPVTHRQMLEQQHGPIPPGHPIGMDPSIDQPAQIMNSVAEMDVDIIIDEAPDAATLQTESFEALANAINASGQSVPLELLIELMPGVPRKSELLKKIRPSEEQQQAQAQQAQQQQQIQDNLLMAQAKKLEADAVSSMSDVQQTQSEIAQNVADARQKLAKAIEIEQQTKIATAQAMAAAMQQGY